MLSIGGIGIFMPVLPTTPFVLIAAACFANSSPQLYEKLYKNRYFGEFLKNYKDGKGIKKTIKVKALLFLWLSLTVSATIIKNLHLTIFLAIVGIAVTTHILRIKTRQKDKENIPKK